MPSAERRIEDRARHAKSHADLGASSSAAFGLAALSPCGVASAGATPSAFCCRSRGGSPRRASSAASCASLASKSRCKASSSGRGSRGAGADVVSAPDSAARPQAPRARTMERRARRPRADGIADAGYIKVARGYRRRRWHEKRRALRPRGGRRRSAPRQRPALPRRRWRGRRSPCRRRARRSPPLPPNSP
ncbi:MAG: hypothetical protein K0R38_2309 [Polyangiaceae bacterium]|nr:hypothetical protein [Polyangiaceae bacterium]